MGLLSVPVYTRNHREICTKQVKHKQHLIPFYQLHSRAFDRFLFTIIIICLQISGCTDLHLICCNK